METRNPAYSKKEKRFVIHDPVANTQYRVRSAVDVFDHTRALARVYDRRTDLWVVRTGDTWTAHTPHGRIKRGMFAEVLACLDRPTSHVSFD